MNARIPLGPCLCGASDCPSCGPAQGYAICDEDAHEGFVQSEIAVLRADPAAVTDALGSLSDGDERLRARRAQWRAAGDHQPFPVVTLRCPMRSCARLSALRLSTPTIYYLRLMENPRSIPHNDNEIRRT